MNNKKNIIDDDIPTHKKKSKKKGQPRSDHKHIYETVLLIRYWHFNYGDSKDIMPTKVCTICGRIDDIDRDVSLYEDDGSPSWAVWGKNLSEKALNLPKWYVNGLDKFAIKEEEN